MASWTQVIVSGAVAAGMLVPAAACAPSDRTPVAGVRAPRAASTAPSTSRVDLARTIADLRARVTDRADPADAVRLADGLLRQTRVTGNGGLAIEAADVLHRVLTADPDRYDARRMLAVVLLSQHRFADALGEAVRCLAVRNDDDVVFGIVGDAHLELGEYERAFDAFDRMNALKPTAASYARASYARELGGDWAEAVRLMRMALEATPPQDVESVAWHHAQLGHLFLEQGRVTDAGREYDHAEFVFPGHPLATEGRARVAATTGDLTRAFALVTARLADRPLPSDFALAGDILAARGRAGEAERQYRLAEAAWRSDVPEPGRLARFLAERRRKPAEALRLAEAAFAERRDIFTADALAFALLQHGQVARADAVMADVLDTGTRDRIILYHAAEIARAAGRTDAARRLVQSALAGSPRFDLVAAPAAQALRDRLATPQVAAR